MIRHGAVVLLAVLAAGPLAAQAPQCQGAALPAARSACNTMVDATRAFHPLAGLLVTGGNPVLGTAALLGGPGHLSVTVRVNALKASLPNPDSAAQAQVPSDFDGYFPVPLVEGAVGVLGGRVSLDALVSATLLPTGFVDGLDVDADAPRIGGIALGLGVGGRIGVLRGAFPVPAMSLSLMTRHIPRVQFGDVTGGDAADFASDLDVTSFRAVVGWRFVLVEAAAGFGIDRYAAAATIRHQDLAGVRVVNLDLATTRRVLFLNGAVSIGATKLVGELGYQTGTDQTFTTNFSDFDPTAGHAFGGLGFRFAL